LQADNYRGAEAVLGWSFYNQGTKERTTSADEFLNWTLGKLNIPLATTSATAKAEAIAETMMRRRVLLLVDGVEPLQQGLDARLGELKDAGLRALLRRFAATSPAEAHGLVVLTSRLAVKDIARWQDSAAPVVNVEQLSDEAGAALLRDNGVWGTEKELKAAANDFGGHALALGLVASFLKETQTGDVRRRDHIRAYLADQENPLHDHAKRVMESYEKEWLAEQPLLLAIMHTVGLFDRPATEGCLRALREKPAIDSLTDKLVDLSEIEWQRAVARLREGRLLAPADQSSSNTLDAHPLVREWFGEKLRTQQEHAWRLAHGRLYEYLRETVRDREAPALQEIAPLYQAIPHGCRAGRHREVLEEIYCNRLARRNRNGSTRYYTFYELGASSTDLAAISWFFDRPFEVPAAGLTAANRRWVLGASGLYLHSQGRFAEAQTALHLGLQIDEDRDQDQFNTMASLLGNIAFAVGNLKEAKENSQQRLQRARQSRSIREIVVALTLHGVVLMACGEFELVRKTLIEIKLLEAKLFSEPKVQTLASGHSLANEILPELRLIQRDFAGAHRSASAGLRTSGLSSLRIRAAYQLQVGRSSLGLALSEALNRNQGSIGAQIKRHAQAARKELDEAVERQRLSGRLDFVPSGYRGRSAFRRSLGDWDGAMRDIAEIEEIADVKPMPMKLHLCDMALERARLAFARMEAFAPLNGIIDDKTPKPEPPSETERKHLHDEVARQLAVAADYIEKCGYHHRDEELIELQAVLRGERTFASLSPRV
jgi:tetratricopeptide (TPR) repeat protein